jgi:5-methyltetrahydrofolate--homocysteine methyltransferase
MENILERLKRGDIIVGDGALGTLLMQRGLQEGNPPETINLTEPRHLEEISSIYLEAGAEIITTNTFGASSLRLQHYSLEAETERINRMAVEAARKAVGDRAYVSGSVGPTGKLLKPYGDTDPEAVFASFRQQIGALISGGIDVVCIETMTDLTETELAVKAARELNPEIPVMATVTFRKTPRGFFTIMGSSIRETAGRLKNAGANIIGSNCGNGAGTMLEIAREMMQYAELPVAIQSNAGLPVHSDKGLFYPETPEFVAEKAASMLQYGVQIVGGCCGTGPDHIRAMRKVVDAYLQSKT